MTTPNQYLFAAFVVVSVGHCILAYFIRSHLEQRGYPASLFGVWRDLNQLTKLIDSENDPVLRRRYQRLRFSLLASIISVLLLLFAYIATFSSPHR